MASIATRIWISTGLLHQEHPDRTSFQRSEIRAKCSSLPGPQPEEGSVQAHLTQHIVANYKPSNNRKRYLLREADDTLRLYRPGDPHADGRESGPVCPKASDLPEAYRHLHEWYWSEYASRKPMGEPQPDPIMALRGVGKEHWDRLGGTKFIDALRADWLGPSEKKAAASKPIKKPSLGRFARPIR